MKVLIADFDLFHKMGGGQTFYRSLIDKNPQINFYYLRKAEPSETKLPSNTQAILYYEKYFITDFVNFHDLTPPKWIYRAFVIASNIAASVAGQQFDVVDLPDYEQIGTLIAPALRHHHVSFERIILSMHGNISTSIKLDWFNEGKFDQTLELQERIQYSVVDVRYGISKTHLDKWRETVNLESCYLNPLSFISLPKPKIADYTSSAPSINFIGRTEKLKGPDIFVELASWLNASSFSTANIIGSNSYSDRGVSSGSYLEKMINNRLKNIKMMPAINEKELAKLFNSKSITILPSRYDTLNLIAIESLFSGCPTVIGSGAGVCRFLKENFPNVPFIIVDIKNIYSCISSICSVLDNYDEYRKNLVDVLLNCKVEIPDLNMESVYESAADYDSAIRNEMDEWYSQIISFYASGASLPQSLKNVAVRFVKGQGAPGLIAALKDFKLLVRNPRSFIKKKLLIKRTSGNDLRILEQALKSISAIDRYKYLFNLGEGSEKELSEKIQQCWKFASNSRIDRVRIWREIARLERIRGNEFVAATYQLRGMRSLGCDRFGDLPYVINTLKANGFSREALVAEAMYSKSPERDERCTAILEQALSGNKLNQKWEYEFVDDRRDLATYRATIIVSLYNAAAKLPLFLEALKHQTMIKAGVAEVILIDSGSPADEYSVFQNIMMSLDIPIVYARSAKRETIQSAWNRGIALSRSPYLTFLGVDEAILPDCLEILTAELDADPSLDWVQGNSLVTNVDKHGTWVNDIMLYDRTGYKQDLVYLETCYISSVGALYRRSIHDRVGFYDATFTAAGDTEFKNRILPFIKTKVIPRTVGFFWNYPEERTTQHPRAEIEDLRAWYLHRTLPGIKYAFAHRDPSEAEDLLYTSLRYRKSYCRHWSTDLEYAYNCATFLQEKLPDSPALKYMDGIKKVLEAYRVLDWVPKLSQLAPISALLRTNRIATATERQHQAIEPIYKIFNDNRHEQHSYLWFTEIFDPKS